MLHAVIAAKISSRQPARRPFGPKKISFVVDLLSGGRGGGASPLERIPVGVMVLLNKVVTEPCPGLGHLFSPLCFPRPRALARMV